MANKKFNIGFISSHGHDLAGHIIDQAANPDLESIHLCLMNDKDVAQRDLDINKIAEASEKVKTKTKNIDDILNTKDLDAVAVCARPDLAPDIFNKILDANLPIITDKPASNDSKRLDTVAKKAAKKNLAFGTMLQWRRNPAILDIKRAVDSGALGQIMTVEVRLLTSTINWRGPGKSYLLEKSSMGGGISSWLACHMLDMVIFILDERVTEVSAFTGNRHPVKIDVEDTAISAIKTESGILGSVHTGYSLCGPGKFGNDIYLGIRGTEGYVSIPFYMPGQEDLDNTLYLYSENENWVTGGQRAMTYSPYYKTQFGKSGVDLGSGGYGGFMAEKLFVDFLNSTRNQGKNPTPIEDLVHVLEIGEAIRESSDSGKAISISKT